MNRQQTRQAYREGRAPWDIGNAQPALVELLRKGLVRGAVLDVGCGTGENLLQMACLGHEAWGIDAAPEAIELAKAKAAKRDLPALFMVADALAVPSLGRRFETILDSGFFHCLSDAERQAYAAQMWRFLKPGGMLHILCFRDRGKAPNLDGMRRLHREDFARSLRTHFEIVTVRPAVYQLNPDAGMVWHPAWLATLRRRNKPGKPPARTERTPRPPSQWAPASL